MKATYRGAGLSGRSTPTEFRDSAHVQDRDGRLWSYSEPADVWKMRLDGTTTSGVALTSARSWDRLLTEFGPLEAVAP